MNDGGAIDARASGPSRAEAKPGGARDAPGPTRPAQRLARGLEDVSHLFLSRSPAAAPSASQGRDHPNQQADHSRQRSLSPAAGGAPVAGVGRLLSLVCKGVGALEEGLRVVDASVDLEVGGTLDLVAVDRSNRLVIIDVEPAANDGLLLRGVCHLDWFARNVEITRRMYSGYGIDFASAPRVFLLAPRFSPAVLCASRRLAPLAISCIAYDAAPLLAGTGMVFTYV